MGVFLLSPYVPTDSFDEKIVGKYYLQIRFSFGVSNCHQIVFHCHCTYFTSPYNSHRPSNRRSSTRYKYKMALTCTDICKFLLAFFLPPLGVLAEKGCGVDLLINILLTILGYIPGIIHACYIILKY
ncbi:unnamed protein product [Allacma fusca]|uniref:Plasma membrane proteolipid 3 n=1 Tax=Allacma fusca TaxID=39272 RepID=A0A8J2LQT5_9HEXA|nr:unnamed protein product [Allacma fusca]